MASWHFDSFRSHSVEPQTLGTQIPYRQHVPAEKIDIGPHWGTHESPEQLDVDQLFLEALVAGLYVGMGLLQAPHSVPSFSALGYGSNAKLIHSRVQIRQGLALSFLRGEGWVGCRP